MAVASATELDSVGTVTRKFYDLLDLARDIKPEATVEPALPLTELTVGVDVLHDAFYEQHDLAYRYNVVETAARQLFYQFVASSNIREPGFAEVWNLLDILILCGDKAKCTPELVCWLLEELLDSQTTHGCRIVFDYLESRKERLVQKDFHKKNLVFLRSCNELLRRLSRAEDANFCGRVFFFLFQTFPLGDKSSVNLRGEFHTENTTTFEATEIVKEGTDNAVVTEKTESVKTRETPKPEIVEFPSKPKSRVVPVKAPPPKVEEEVLSTNDLYPIFWRLQQDFSDPTRLFTPGHFQAFRSGLTHTIAKFRKTPTVVQAKSTNESKRGIKRKHGVKGIDGKSNEDEIDHFAENYNPKYLTSRDLFDLELSDMAFQRHILVQSLILIDFLLSLTEKAKKRLAALETANKSMLYQFTLSEDDAKWALSTRSTITSYMSSTLEGKLFNRMVETVLARDKNWIRWKIESCPSIVRDPISVESDLEARKGAQNASRVRRIANRPASAINLDFLDDSNEGIESLKDPSRYITPSIAELIDGIKTDELDLDMAMDDEEKSSLENSIANKRWRVLRQARITNLAILDKITPDKNLESVFSPAPVSETEEVKETGEAEEQVNGMEVSPNQDTEENAQEATAVAADAA